ncbi:MAG TPA: hypothetical protein VIY47_14830, partial [Ignavibacteriaceae bacterium]
ITFKTGDLLISDWFRIDEFTEATKIFDLFDIESADGRQKQAACYMNELGFISVNTGNLNPSIYQKNGVLSFCSSADSEDYDYDSNPKEFKKIGNVDTELWNVTIIDKQQLIDIISITNPEKAKELVDRYIQKYSENIVQVKVNPGTFYLYHHGDHYLMEKEFHAPALSMPESLTPSLLLSDHKLELTPRPPLNPNVETPSIC